MTNRVSNHYSPGRRRHRRRQPDHAGRHADHRAGGVQDDQDLRDGPGPRRRGKDAHVSLPSCFSIPFSIGHILLSPIDDVTSVFLCRPTPVAGS